MVLKIKLTVTLCQGGDLTLRCSAADFSPFCGHGRICCSIARRMKGSEQATSQLTLGIFLQPSPLGKFTWTSSLRGWGSLISFSYVSWKKLVSRLPIDYRSVEIILFCVFVSGNLGEPVLLPFWLSLPGVYNPGGILLTNQHCHGVLPALCWGEISPVVVSVAQGARLFLTKHRSCFCCCLAKI